MSELQLYNSLSRKKESFEPQDPSHVRLYACGPTVYSYAHIGNARMAVVFDTLTRLLKTLYPKVTYVSNITDVDDKIMATSKETGEPIAAITEKFTQIYNADMAALGCDAPDIQPKATTHIGEMIALIQRLIDTGHAYEADGHVLFNVPSFPAYGGLSGRSRDEQIAGARVEVASYKKDPADFVLWKPSTANEPGWDSPFGYGRPGWHIECSAMAEKHLGLPFDIHGGGADLKFPHHENEIAQSCCASGHLDDLSSFAKTWVHNGFVTVEGEKMSKSLGNVVLAHDLIQNGDITGMQVRLALLSAHYRKPLDWGERALHQASILLDKIRKTLGTLNDIDGGGLDAAPDSAVLAALRDDLNTPLALTRLQDLIKTIQKADADDLPPLKGTFVSTFQILGLDPDLIMARNETGSQSSPDIDPDWVETKLRDRADAKKNKDFSAADAIRDELAALGVFITDTPDGTQWSVE